MDRTKERTDRKERAESPVQSQMTFAERRNLTKGEFVAYLNEGARERVSVAFHRNRVTMISVVFEPNGSIRVRAHEAFLAAGPEVLRALRTYLRTRRRKAWRGVTAFADTIPATTPARKRRTPLRTRGDVHDLDEIARDVNRTFFSDRIRCRVGWGRAGRGRRGRKARSIRYGSWDATTRTVRVNPRLDDKRVPREFVRYIVFHEMLHAVVPAVIENGRRRTHTAQFRALEKGFPKLEKMTKLCDRLWRVV